MIRRKALSRYLQARANAVPGKMLAPHFLPSGAPQKLGFDADRLERLHRGMKRFVETGRHAGVSLLLVRDGQMYEQGTAHCNRCNHFEENWLRVNETTRQVAADCFRLSMAMRDSLRCSATTVNLKGSGQLDAKPGS